LHLPFHVLNPSVLGLVVAYDASITSRQVFVNSILYLCLVGESVIAIIAVNPEAGAERRLTLVEAGGKRRSARIPTVKVFLLDRDIAFLGLTGDNWAEPVNFGWQMVEGTVGMSVRNDTNICVHIIHWKLFIICWSSS